MVNDSGQQQWSTTVVDNSCLTSADIGGMGKQSAVHLMLAECILMAFDTGLDPLTDLASYPLLRQAAFALVHCSKQVTT